MTVGRVFYMCLADGLAATRSISRHAVVKRLVDRASPGIRTAALSSKRHAPSHNPMPTQDELKKQVGFKAVDDYVRSGMVVGLGTGSTAYFAVQRVGEKLKSGELKDIVAIPTSVRTKEQAEELGIPLTTLGTPESRFSKLDVAIDGADAVDPALNLIKGGGGALFREKIVEECAEKFIVIVDDSKIVDGLGPSFALPVEIAPFCWEHTMRAISELPSLAGGKPQLPLTLTLINPNPYPSP